MKTLFGLIVLFSLPHLDVRSQVIAPVIIKSVDPTSAQKDILGVLDKMKASADDPLVVNDLIHELDSKWNYYARFNIVFESSFREEMMSRLIAFYDSIEPDSEGINFANKVRILEFIGPRDNSSEIHRFYLRELDTPNKNLQEYVLRSVGGKMGVNGDDIYNKIKELVVKRKLSEAASLRYLKAASKKRALRDFQVFIKKTNDLNDFITAGIFLCDYRDPAVLDVLADRYPDFKPKPRKSFGDNPAFAFTNEMLKKYIEYASGKKLVRALEIANDAGTFGNEELPLFGKKLRDENTIVGRTAVVDFILQKVRQGFVSKNNALLLLKDAINQKNAPEVKGKIIDGIRFLEQKE